MNHSPEGSQRIDFSEAYGETGKLVLRAPEPDAPEGIDDEAHTD